MSRNVHAPAAWCMAVLLCWQPGGGDWRAHEQPPVDSCNSYRPHLARATRNAAPAQLPTTVCRSATSPWVPTSRPPSLHPPT